MTGTRPFPVVHAAITLAAAALASPVQAREGLDLSATYVADLGTTLSGGADRKARYLDNLELNLDGDLEKLWGVPGASFHITVLANQGLRPNDGAGSLEGVDNIEVARASVRLFEAWAEQRSSAGSLRLGLYDLNSEFYATNSAALLIAPPFGIGSELSASGSNGPSNFPSSALAARLRIAVAPAKAYAQVALLNAKAQTLGDPGGVDLGFDEGLIAIGEVGAGDRLRVSLGAWTYTRPATALAATDPAGNPLRQREAGLYSSIEAHLARSDRREITAFLRGGAARGRTQQFTSSVQAGLFVRPALTARRDSAFSLGFHQSRTSADFSSAQTSAGQVPWERERALELTYLDAVTSALTLQPDLQLTVRSSAAGRSPLAVHATLRAQITF